GPPGQGAPGGGEAERWQRSRSPTAAASSALRLQNINSARRVLEVAPTEYRNWEWLHLNSQLETGRLVLGGPESKIGSVAISPDGNRVAAGAQNGSVRVWDTGTGKDVFVAPGQNRSVDGLAFSPDGRSLFAFHDDGVVHSWDVGGDNQGTTLRVSKALINGSAFSPDRRRLAVCSVDGAAHLWDLATGKELAILAGRLGTGETRVTFAPD